MKMQRSYIYFMRCVSGFLLAPLVSAGLQTLLMGSHGAALILIFTYPFSWFLGIPSFLVARHLGLTDLKSTVLGSCVLGFFAVGLTVLIGGGQAGGFSALSVTFGALFIALHATLIGASFWFIAFGRFGPTQNQR
ncbi:hypothetical protein [uncultured Agrobacterium sp.]|uniref:hypothetical protein n=1 Tax=uncultured Agrobacterium sp. TaxID=157277 RepID=UPI0025ED99E8|nr:hypothetical protein [uncultured Agrobacterium sp.]